MQFPGRLRSKRPPSAETAAHGQRFGTLQIAGTFNLSQQANFPPLCLWQTK